jgi:hypothetical protein
VVAGLLHTSKEEPVAFRRWIWCRDTTTGHHLDIDEKRLDGLVKAGAVEPVPDYEVNEGFDARPRPAKPNLSLGHRASQPDDFTDSDGSPAGSESGAQASDKRAISKAQAAAPSANTTTPEGSTGP